jgi:DMSO/TMAO reductase YedYZ molybdopterin-dependent catalytic subunit
VALAIVILAPWKSAIARRGLRRRRGGSWASLAFTVLISTALLAGLGHATGLLQTIGGGVTAMQLHVGAALASIPFAVWHVTARRVRPRRTDLSRRTVLRTLALGAGSLAAYGSLIGVIRLAGLPGRARRFTGSFEAGSLRPEAMPVTQWGFDQVPNIHPRSWHVSVLVHGTEVERLSLSELDAMAEPVRAVIDCTGGWFAEQDWEGVRLDRVFPSDLTARSVRAVSVTGYSRRFPTGDLSRLWLAVRAGSEPLSGGHGFPARIVAPGRRGFWWVKWVEALEASDIPWWWQSPFPLP